VLGFELVGGEIPDSRFRVRRTVRATDPADLASPLEYAAEVLADDDPAGTNDPAAGLRPSCGWVLAALRAGGPMQTVKGLGDHLAAQGHALKQRTIQAALADLEAAGLAEGTDDPGGRARYWSAVAPDEADDSDPDGEARHEPPGGYPVGTAHARTPQLSRHVRPAAGGLRNR
jgi:hypothetical protein